MNYEHTLDRAIRNLEWIRRCLKQETYNRKEIEADLEETKDLIDGMYREFTY